MKAKKINEYEILSVGQLTLVPCGPNEGEDRTTSHPCQPNYISCVPSMSAKVHILCAQHALRTEPFTPS